MIKSATVYWRTVLLLIISYIIGVFLFQNHQLMKYHFWGWQVNIASSYVHVAGFLLGYVACKLINYKPVRNYFS